VNAGFRLIGPTRFREFLVRFRAISGSRDHHISYNLPNTVSYNGNSTQFFYNASHQRWKQIANYAGTVETTNYIGGMLEVMTRGSGPTEYRHQIPGGSGTAVYTRRSDSSTGTYYATSYHLGSSDLVMDSAGNVLTRESFTPFGARRGSSWAGVPSAADYTAFGNTTRKGFTGQEMLDSVSLVHMNGRVYDPYLGRFISADTVIQSLGATESINPYAYAWNDPLKYVDPTGHGLGDIIGALVGIVLAIVAPELITAIATYFTGAGLTLASTALVGSPISDTVDNRRSRNGGCHEEVEVHRVTDRRDPEGRGSWRRAERADEEARDQLCDLLQLAREVRWGERLGASSE